MFWASGSLPLEGSFFLYIQGQGALGLLDPEYEDFPRDTASRSVSLYPHHIVSIAVGFVYNVDGITLPYGPTTVERRFSSRALYVRPTLSKVPLEHILFSELFRFLLSVSYHPHPTFKRPPSRWTNVGPLEDTVKHTYSPSPL